MERKGTLSTGGKMGGLSQPSSHLQNGEPQLGLQASWQSQVFRLFWEAKKESTDLTSGGRITQRAGARAEKTASAIIPSLMEVHTMPPLLPPWMGWTNPLV